MKYIIALILFISSNAFAADNAVVVTTGSGLTLRSRDVGAGVQSLQQILGDTSGNALATAPGTPNSVFALPVQGVTGGTAVPVSGTLTVSGVATAANQATEITSLSTIASNTGAAIPPQSVAVPVGGFGICDGANGVTNPCTTVATVKAASTAALFTDKALVVASIPGSLSHASVTSLGTSLVLKASAGQLTGFNCTGIAGATAGYCIAYNGTTAPSTGALTGANVLDACYFDTTARGCSLIHVNGSIAYSTGIVILMSSATTPFTYTTGTNTGFISGDYN